MRNQRTTDDEQRTKTPGALVLKGLARMLVVSRQLSVVSCKSEARATVGLRARRRSRAARQAFRLPLSALRLGLSLTEVLISMGILTLGLLGVASVFPVGSFYMQKAEISDKASAIAQSVMSDIATRGMLDPNSWYVMVPMPSPNNRYVSGNYNKWNSVFPPDHKYSTSVNSMPGTFTRPFAAALSQALDPSLQPNVLTDSTLICKQFGSAYVLDPLGVSQMAFVNPAQSPPMSWVHGPVDLFPATAYMNGAYYLQSPAWAPWLGNGSQGYLWPIRRATFRQPTTGGQMSPSVAEHYFRGSDDLSFDFPARADRPAFQSWDTVTNSSGNVLPLARKWMGDYSWLVTIAPTSRAAQTAMVRNPEGSAYDVSVVVFYKRPLPDTANSTYASTTSSLAYQSTMGMGERAVRARVVSTGLNGGELLLTDFNDAVDAGGKKLNAFDQLKSGQWLMLCGPHPNSSTAEPRFVLLWYQVISADAVPSDMIGYDSSKPQRVVTVRGAEWPWQPPAAPTSATDPVVSNNLCVAICKGAVAVHTKSMRLEGQGSAYGTSGVGFGNSGNPTTTPPPYVLH